MRRERILLFSPGLSDIGGAARHSRALAEGLAHRGWEVRVIARSGGLRRFNLIRSQNLLVLEVPGFGSPAVGGLLFIVCAVPLGLIWAFGAKGIIGLQLMSQVLSASCVSLVTGKPFLAQGMGSGELSDVAYVLSSRSVKLRLMLIRRAYRLVAQTKEMAEEMSRLVPEDQVVIVRNPVSLLPSAPLSQYAKALYFGRLSEEKGLVRLMEAWRVVASADPDARLTIAGAGGAFRSVEDQLREMVLDDDILRSTVDLPGWVEDVGRLLSESDVYVLPSRSEGLSNALLEACAAGRVVVASDISSNREVLGDSYPLLFEAHSTAALIEALKRALYDENVRHAALEATSERMKQFSSETVFKRWEELLDEGAARQKSGRSQQ